MTPQTEQEHLRVLIDVLGQAQDAAGLRLQSALIAYLHAATSEATALGFYRNQRHWMAIAAILDEVAKRTVPHRDWPRVVELLSSLRTKVHTLANRGTH